ncbi:MAG TPA: site-2 protease family protein [Trebonia sp.]|nr:site-2 protease family protein [Trebonia sp.]
MASSQGEPARTGQPGNPPPGDGQRPGRQRNAGMVIARPFGIPVFISPYWIVIAALYVVLYANNFRGALGDGAGKYLLAAVFVILLYLSVLVHELSHSIVARGYGLPVRRIVLYPLGGVSEIDKEPETPLREFCVSAAGPALSLVLAGIGWGLTNVFVTGWSGELVWQLLWVNIIVGVFNLAPGLPLDGGRMLRAVIWKFTKKPATATIAAAWVGRGLAVALLLFVLYYARSLTGGVWFAAIWVAVIAAFMWIGAGQSIRATKFRERLPELQARRLARKAVSVPASTPLAEAIRRADESRARAVVVVDHDNKPVAILNEAAVMATPPQRRPWVDAGSLARSIEPDLVLPVDISGMALLDAIRRAPASEYLLVEPSGQVYGVLAARDLDHVFAGV